MYTDSFDILYAYLFENKFPIIILCQRKAFHLHAPLVFGLSILQYDQKTMKLVA